jgi:hypothetical protein
MKKKRIIAGIVIILVLGIIGAGAWLFMSGRLVWVGSPVVANASQSLCGTDKVNTYNDAMYLLVRDGGDEATLDTEGLATLKKDIMNTGGYENDATCQTMLFWMAVNDGDYEVAVAAKTKLLDLHKAGYFADSNIRGNDALFTYDAVLFPLSPEAATPQEADSAS